MPALLAHLVQLVQLVPTASGGPASYDLSRYTSSGSSVNMSFNYPGITLVPATPSPLSLDNSTGWLDQEILNEVVANTGQDATGYALQGSAFSVADVFGVGKALSRLKTFVICQAPTITMVFTQRTRFAFYTGPLCAGRAGEWTTQTASISGFCQSVSAYH